MPELSISETIESYLNERKSELSDSSIQNHRYQLKQWKQWCKGEEIASVAGIEPIHLSRFRRSRAKDINSNTMYNQLSSLRLYLDYCARMNWIDESIPESIVLPTRSGIARDRSIDEDTADSILDGLDRFQRASRAHVIFVLLYQCGLRIGTLRALDVDDVKREDQYLDIRHRPETDTSLKNKNDGERHVNLCGWVISILEDWLDGRRFSETDAYDREPLISTSFGRISRTSIRRTIYRLTDCSSVGTPENCQCSPRPSMCDESALLNH